MPIMWSVTDVSCRFEFWVFGFCGLEFWVCECFDCFVLCFQVSMFLHFVFWVLSFVFLSFVVLSSQDLRFVFLSWSVDFLALSSGF